MRRPRIFYHCFDSQGRSGGQKHVYQHVDILNMHGFEAYVLHQTKNFRLGWFDNQTHIITPDQFETLFDPGRDFLVLPETFGSRVLTFPGRKVIFNKNAYHGFAAFGHQRAPADPYADRGVEAAFAVSEHNAAWLRFAYPDLRVFQLRSGIESSRFAYRPIEKKKRQIAFIDKGVSQLAPLFHMLRARAASGHNTLAGCPWIMLCEMSEAEVSAVLQDSLVFVFLSVEEGLPRMVLEAQACGCLVVGFGQGPVPECLPEHMAFAYSDLVGMAQRIEAIMAAGADAASPWRAQAEAGRALAESYSPRRQAQTVVEAWTTLLESEPAAREPAAAPRAARAEGEQASAPPA